jgi:predicted DNA-binding transcriptional regulator YafY
MTSQKKVKEQDSVAVRLVQIITKLNNGESLFVKELAEEFNVTPRTIQKDLNERLDILPFIKENSSYKLESYCLGKLSFKDIKVFAEFSGLKELYPVLNNHMIVDILNKKVSANIEVRGQVYENLSLKVEPFNHAAAAILNKQKLQFTYSAKPRTLEPYKLVNTHGIWYLVGVEDGILKHFSFSKVEKLMVLDTCFVEDEAIVEILLTQTEGWVTQEPQEVMFSVSQEVAEYFLRRKLLPQQKMLEHREKDVLFSCQIAYDAEILRLVRYWIPHLHIVSPAYLQVKLEEELKGYLSS